jgi:hypothetical protein
VDASENYSEDETPRPATDGADSEEEEIVEALEILQVWTTFLVQRAASIALLKIRHV